MLAEYVIIKELTEKNSPPYHLLLLADPSRQAVEEYLQRGMCYLAFNGEQVIGAYILLRTRPFTMEVVNLVIQEEFQGQGLGKRLLLDAVGKARTFGAKVLELGTGNSSLKQLRLYQQCGFRITGVDRDFFIRHYDEAIMEDGIPCRDMIRLSADL